MNSEEMNNTSEPTGTGSTSPEESTPEASPPPTPPTQSGGADDGVGRRDILKALAGVPFVGWIFWRALRKKGLDDYRKEQILEELGDLQGPSFVSDIHHPAGEKIRLGIIGYGGEGNWLTRCAGFATKATTDAWTEAVARDPGHTALRDFMNQPDLNLEITAVCDVFDNRAEAVMDAARNTTRPGGEGKPVPEVKRYRHYRDLLASGDVDAVIIATPDHWHSRMAIEAARQGIHVYLEKAMTRTEQEALDLHRAVTEAGIAFQLGHQNRQIESHEKAREVVERGILGDINLVETTTNRNTPGGAWVYGIDPEGSPETIDWELFQEPAPHHVPFSAERFFRWRCWFDYGTGLSGDLFSHEYDSVNQILHLGIPERVSATGGIYFYRTDRFHDIFDPEEYPMQENRDVPDVFHISCEYPERRLTLLYSATLSNNRGRGMTFMGHDASMEVGGNLTVYACGNSTRYQQKIRRGIIDTSLPLFHWQEGSERIDAVTSASDRYFITRGLMYTYRGGVRLPTNHLHIAEWLRAIRDGGTTSCNIDRGLEEAMTCHMATRSYLEGRRMRWDPVRRRIVPDGPTRV